MKIIFQKSFQKQLLKLWPKLKNKFKERLGIFLNNKFDPILNYHKLNWELSEFSSINISWDIRALFVEQWNTIEHI